MPGSLFFVGFLSRAWQRRGAERGSDWLGLWTNEKPSVGVFSGANGNTCEYRGALNKSAERSIPTFLGG